MIKLLVDGEEVKFTTTVFPDGTSQVWKVEKDLFHDATVLIQWNFENEAELFQVCQLAVLLDTCYDVTPHLFCPYMPYARQDKEVSNTSTFASSIFTGLLKRSSVYSITGYDTHSPFPHVKSISAEEFHKSVFTHDIVCFPDKGAAARYKDHFPNVPVIYFDKQRDPTTGQIKHSKMITEEPIDLKDKKILIVDDICDGGATFIQVAGFLQLNSTTQIDLAVSHGLFSKGKQVLHNAGITNIFTTNSLLRNPEGFKVC